MKRLLIYVLIVMLTVTCIPPVNAVAAESDNAVETQAAVQSEPADDDGLLLRKYEDFADVQNRKISPAANSSKLTHNSRFKDYVIENGVDISHHNGVVNWKKVKADGYDFAIIRMAYRGYGSSGNLKTDNYAISNLKNAKAAGLDVGVYIFSQAVNVKEAQEEADYILDLIKGYSIDLPVVLDYEYTAGNEGRLQIAKNKGMTDRQRTDVCLAFCKKVEAAGYDAMVYANKSMLSTDLYADEIDSKYEIWLAEWTTKAKYNNDYTYWQYTSDGSVNGVPSERVDLNVRYTHPPFNIIECTYSTVTMEWKTVDSAEGYQIYRSTEDGEYELVAEIDDPAETSFTDEGLTHNTVYSYMLKCCKTGENGEPVIFDSGYSPQKTVTKLKLERLNISAVPVNAGTVEVTWAAEPNATGYIVQQDKDNSGKYSVAATIYCSADESTIASKNDCDFILSGDGNAKLTVNGLTAGTDYSFKVRAFADVGGAKVYNIYSVPVTVKTASTLTKPVLTAKPYSYTTNKLSWKAVPGATSYQIQRYKSADKKWVTVKTVSGTSYSHTYLDCSLTYKYRVRAIAKGSAKTYYSSYSDIKAAKTKGSRIGIAKDGPLNIRTGPGTGYKKLFSVKKGVKLTITGSTAKWYKVRVKVSGKYRTGYVSKTYVKLK